MPKQHINPKTIWDSHEYGFSQVVTSQGGQTVYLSGQTPWDVNQQIIGTNRGEQMRQALRSIQAALDSVGGTLADVVSLRIYMVNYQPEEWTTIAAGLKEFFPHTPPATTWIGVSSLAVKEFLIEIEAIAVLE